MSLHAHFQEALQYQDPPSHMKGTESPHTSGAIPFSRPASPGIMHDQMAFVGLGAIGHWCALNLARKLDEEGKPSLIVWNRGSDGIDLFKALADKEQISYKVAGSLEEIGQKADIILASLGSDHASEEVFQVLFAAQEKKVDRGKSTIFVDMSTIAPETADRLERTCSSKPTRHFLCAPVFGPPPYARDAQLIMAMGGQYHAKKRVSHALCPAVVRKVMDLGSDVERAAKFKLTGNAMVLGCIELLAETTTLADQSGVGAEKLYELIQDFFPAPSLISYGKKIINDNFKTEEGFSLAGGIKDASHIRKLAEDSRVPMPMIDTAHQHLITARAVGGADLDWSSLVAGQRIAAGLPPFKRHVRLEKYED